MKKRLILYITGLIVLIISAFFIIQHHLPKMASYYPFFVILVLLDLYLWNSLRNKIFKLKKIAKFFLVILYWLPLAAWLVTIIVFLFKPYYEYDSGFIVYFYGSLFVIYVSKVFPVVFLLIADLVRMTQCAINRIRAVASKSDLPAGQKISRSKFLQTLGLVTGGIAMSGFVTGMVKWATEFRIWKHSISLPTLPDAYRGLKIVQISDLHLGSWTSKESLKEAVDMINHLSPDLVFFTGDLVNYTTDEAYKYEKILREINSVNGVYAVLGNHDYGDYVGWDNEDEKARNLENLVGFFEKIDWKLLRNNHAIIERSGEKLAVVGVENWSSIDRFPQYGDIIKAKQGTDDIPVKLLLSHDPTHWDKQISKEHPDIDITFSGHTHGFQFGVEYKNLKWSPAKYLYKQWAGLYTHQQYGKTQYLYVNRGIGNIGYPGRIGIMPEISFFELA